uniref:Replicase large subunit n=1 Tax=Atrato Virga-like virus 4 TaxID=2689343 RepID=A0A6B9KLE6_9VIRU|nr:polyprotein [Atrato Virga-like virus 4]
MCALAGTDIHDHFAEAARRQLKVCIEAPDQFLKDAMSTLLTTRQPFHIPYMNDPVATAQLQREYPELNITTGTTHQPHAYAAAARLAAEELILRKMKYDKKTTASSGYDVPFKDIGGNFARHAVLGRYNVHSCAPCLSFRDSARETTRREILVDAVASGKLSKTMCEAYLNKNGTKQRCYQRGELCELKAKYVLLVHSQYDVDLAAFRRMLDASEPIVVISVVNFTPAIMYAEHGSDGTMGMNWHKTKDGLVKFDFVNDPSLGYAHDYRAFIQMISAQVIVTEKGRVYLCERFVRGDAMFLQYTYCSEKPEVMTLHAEYSLWDAYASEKVILCAWDFDHRRYVDSKFTTPKNHHVRFTRRFISVCSRFFEMLYTHCVRSGDKSFNFNEVFSAASTFNTKMSINGNDVRSVQRVPTDELVLAVVTIYCIAYRDRYQAGKSIEGFVASEKDARGSNRLGFAACFSAAWKTVTSRSNTLTTLLEKWNSFVDSVAEINSRSDLDVRMLGAVRCIRFSEFITVDGEFEGSRDGLRDISIGAVDVSVDEKGFLNSIVKVMRERIGSPEVQAKALEQPEIPVVRAADPEADPPQHNVPPLQRVYDRDAPATGATTDLTAKAVFSGPPSVTSNKSARALKNNFHQHMSQKKGDDPARLIELRNSKYSCKVRMSVVPVPADGNCMYSALAHYTGNSAAEMRRILYDASTVKDEDILLMDGSRKSWGSTDEVVVFSRLYQCRMCIHMEENGVACQTMVYTDESVPQTAPVHHLRWQITGNVLGNYSAHVDVLSPNEDVSPPWKTLFAAVRMLPHPVTDEYQHFDCRQELKGLSLIDRVGRKLHGLSVLELGAAPGAWTRIFLPIVTSTGGEYHAVSHPTGLPYYDDIRDFECANAKFFKTDAMQYLISTDHTYDLVLCDVATANSWERMGTQIGLLRNARRVLKKGGDLVLKLSNVFLADADSELNATKGVFTSVSLVKPTGCRMRNSECYVVAVGYGGQAEYSDPVVDRKTIATAVGQFCAALTPGVAVKPVDCDEKFASLCETYLSVEAAAPPPEDTEPLLVSFLAEVFPKSEVKCWEGLSRWLHESWPKGDMYQNLPLVGVYPSRNHYDIDDVVTRLNLTKCAYLPSNENSDALVERFTPIADASTVVADQFDLAHLTHSPNVYAARVANPSLVPQKVEGYPHILTYRAQYTAFDDPSVFLVCSKEALVAPNASWRMHLRAGIEHAVAGKGPIPVDILKYQLKGLTAGGILEDLDSLTACPEHPDPTGCHSGCHTCLYLSGPNDHPGLMLSAWRHVYNYVRRLPSQGLRDHWRLWTTMRAPEDEHMGAWMTLLRREEQGHIADGRVVSMEHNPVVKFYQKHLPSQTLGRAANALEPGMRTFVDPVRKERVTTRTYGTRSQLEISFHGARGETLATCGKDLIPATKGIVMHTHPTRVIKQPLRSVRDVQTTTEALVDVVCWDTYEPVRWATSRQLSTVETQTFDTEKYPLLVRLKPRALPVSVQASRPSPPPSSDTTDSIFYAARKSDGTSVTSSTPSILAKAKAVMKGDNAWLAACKTTLARVKGKRSDTQALIEEIEVASTISVATGKSTLGLGNDRLFSSASEPSDDAEKGLVSPVPSGDSSWMTISSTYQDTFDDAPVTSSSDPAILELQELPRGPEPAAPGGETSVARPRPRPTPKSPPTQQAMAISAPLPLKTVPLIDFEPTTSVAPVEEVAMTLITVAPVVPESNKTPRAPVSTPDLLVPVPAASTPQVTVAPSALPVLTPNPPTAVVPTAPAAPAVKEVPVPVVQTVQVTSVKASASTVQTPSVPSVPAKPVPKPVLAPVTEEVEMVFVNKNAAPEMSEEDRAWYAAQVKTLESTFAAQKQELLELSKKSTAPAPSNLPAPSTTKLPLPGSKIPAFRPPGQVVPPFKPTPGVSPGVLKPSPKNDSAPAAPVPSSSAGTKPVPAAPAPNAGTGTKSVKRNLADLASLRLALPRSKARDSLATRSIWTAYPHDCKIHLAFCHRSGETLVLPPGLAKRVGVEIASLKKLRAAGFRDFEAPSAGWTGLWRTSLGNEVVVSVKTGNHEQVVRAVLKWLPEDVARVSVEATVELGDTALANVVRDVGRPVCLVDSRTRNWRGFMHILEPLKNPLPTTTNTHAFPKLTPKEKGLVDDPPWIHEKSNVDKFRNSMIEYRYLTENSDNFNKAEFRRQKLHPKNGIPSDKLGSMARAGYNVYDQETQTYLVQSPRQKFSHAYSASRDTYVPWDDKKRRFQTDDRYVLVSKFTEIMLNQQILEIISPLNVANMEMPEIQWINGPPGCGKTYTIVQTTTISTSATEGKDLILSMTTEGKLSVQAAVKAKNPSLGDAALKAHIRTVASLFANGTTLVYDRVLIDEALMSHAGMIGYAAALTRTQKILIIGDIHQIPYVDRDHMCNVKYYSPACFTDITSFKEITYRCPVDVTYALSSLYEGFCTNSTVVTSMRRVSYSSEFGALPKDLEDCLYLVHFQSDKDYLKREQFGTGRGSRVLTIHEAQGLTFKHVICIRTSARPLALYTDPPYAVVAVSRHTQSFRYFTDHDDAITDFINRSKHLDAAKLLSWNAPRLVAAKARVSEQQKREAVPKLTAGGLLFEADMYLRPLEAAHDDTLTKGLPAVSHLPLVPAALKRISWSSFVRPAKYKMELEEDIGYLQAFYDSAMPGVACQEYRNDQLLMEYEDTQMFSTDLEVMPLKGIYQTPKFGKLRPRLRTIMQPRKVPSQKESLLGAMKRNLNAPQVANQNLSPEAIGERLFLNFVRSGIDPRKAHIVDMYQNDPVSLSSPVVSAWLEKQPPARRAQIVSDLPMHLRPYNRFSYMVKADVKPQLAPSAQSKYPSVQTIVYNDPCVNAIFCPIYNVLFDRLIAVLHPKVLMYTGMSACEFEQELNAKLSARVAFQCRKVENDFSKYDKAQQAALRRFERLLWEYVGLDPDLSQIWDDSRRESTVTDRKNGVRFQTTFQRKSGEATTFSGNTLVALSIVLAVIDIDNIALVMVAGDDSMVYMYPDATFDDSSKLIADLFNLECKLLQTYRVPYFCSKFLVTTDEWTYVVHDPLKFVTKLGRLDMSNYQHVEEYRVSCLDTMKSLFNPVVTQELSIGVRERYGGNLTDLTKLLCVLKSLCQSSARFASLFVHDRGVVLCKDVNSRKLD